MRKEPVRSKEITKVGLDAHQETIHAGILLPGSGESILESFPNTPDGIRRFIRRLKKRAPGAIECCYEAGPLGYSLQRSLQGLGVGCAVIAPSLIPSKLGDRIQTDRRDARKLAELFRASSRLRSDLQPLAALATSFMNNPGWPEAIPRPLPRRSAPRVRDRDQRTPRASG